eukprot:g6940.t1
MKSQRSFGLSSEHKKRLMKRTASRVFNDDNDTDNPASRNGSRDDLSGSTRRNESWAGNARTGSDLWRRLRAVVFGRGKAAAPASRVVTPGPRERQTKSPASHPLPEITNEASDPNASFRPRAPRSHGGGRPQEAPRVPVPSGNPNKVSKLIAKHRSQQGHGSGSESVLWSAAYEAAMTRQNMVATFLEQEQGKGAAQGRCRGAGGRGVRVQVKNINKAEEQEIEIRDRDVDAEVEEVARLAKLGPGLRPRSQGKISGAVITSSWSDDYDEAVVLRPDSPLVEIGVAASPSDEIELVKDHEAADEHFPLPSASPSDADPDIHDSPLPVDYDLLPCAVPDVTPPMGISQKNRTRPLTRELCLDTRVHIEPARPPSRMERCVVMNIFPDRSFGSTATMPPVGEDENSGHNMHDLRGPPTTEDQEPHPQQATAEVPVFPAAKLRSRWAASGKGNKLGSRSRSGASSRSGDMSTADEASWASSSCTPVTASSGTTTPIIFSASNSVARLVEV